MSKANWKWDDAEAMLRNGLYNAVGTAINIALAVLAIPLLIRLVGLEEYGLWTLVSASVGIISLAEAGLSVSTTVFLSRDLANNDPVGMSQTLTVTMSAMLLLATTVALVLWLSATSVANWFPRLDMTQRVAMSSALQIGGIIVWARLLQQILIGVLQAHQRYDATNILTVTQASLSNLGLVAVAWSGGRAVAMMRWQAIVTCGILIAMVWLSWKLVAPLKLRPTWHLDRGRAIARYSGMAWLASLSSALFSQADRLIVGAILGTGPLGVYAAITSVTTKINSLSGAPVQPLLPELSAMLAKPSVERGRLEQRVKQALSINSVVALGMGATLFAMAPWAMRIMVSDAITPESVLAFRLATVIYALYSVNAVGYYVLFSVNAVGTCVLIQSASTILSLLMIAGGASHLGLLGAAAGNAGYLGVWLLTFKGMRRLGIPMRLWSKWLSFPLAWFLGMVVISSIAFPRNMTWAIIGTVLAMLILLGRFIVTERTRFLPFLNKANWRAIGRTGQH